MYDCRPNANAFRGLYNYYNTQIKQVFSTARMNMKLLDY